MPTARPIIIEKFIDQTDNGVASPSRCSDGEAHRDTGQREDQRDAHGDGGTERYEQQDHRGDPRYQLGAVQSLFVGVVEVAPHGPFAGYLGLSSIRQRRSPSTASMSSPAASGSSASLCAANCTGIITV